MVDCFTNLFEPLVFHPGYIPKLLSATNLRIVFRYYEVAKNYSKSHDSV